VLVVTDASSAVDEVELLSIVIVIVKGVLNAVFGDDLTSCGAELEGKRLDMFNNIILEEEVPISVAEILFVDGAGVIAEEYERD
jgi:hypothetical protein